MLTGALQAGPNPNIEDALRNPVEFPRGIAYLWEWFLELSGTGRIYLEGGLALPLSSSEIYAWCQLKRVRLAWWELEAIRNLDMAWLNVRNRR